MDVGRRGAGIDLKTGPLPSFVRWSVLVLGPSSGGRCGPRGDECRTLFMQGGEGTLASEVAKRMPNGARVGKVVAGWDAG